MASLRWIAAALLFAIFLWCGTLNLVGMMGLRKKYSSPILFTGGVAGICAVWVCPIARIHGYWWLP